MRLPCQRTAGDLTGKVHTSYVARRVSFNRFIHYLILFEDDLDQAIVGVIAEAEATVAYAEPPKTHRRRCIEEAQKHCSVVIVSYGRNTPDFEVVEDSLKWYANFEVDRFLGGRDDSNYKAMSLIDDNRCNKHCGLNGRIQLNLAAQ